MIPLINKACIVVGVILAIIGVTWLGLSIYSWLHYPPQGNQYIPVENPHPQYFMTVSGFIDPSLRYNSKLILTANYQSTNEACESASNIYAAAEGAKAPLHRSIKRVAPTPDAQGNFEIKIPLDYYLPGFCGWQPIVVRFSLPQLNFNTNEISFFNDNQTYIENTVAYQNFLCTNTKNCSYDQGKLYSHETLYYKHNYNYQINIFKESTHV